jgi:excisionase family DNA binding protein
MDQLMYRPAEAARVLGIGRTALFGFIKTGQLQSIKLGGYRLITAEAMRAFVQALEQQATASTEQKVA